MPGPPCRTTRGNAPATGVSGVVTRYQVSPSRNGIVDSVMLDMGVSMERKKVPRNTFSAALTWT